MIILKLSVKKMSSLMQIFQNLSECYCTNSLNCEHYVSLCQWSVLCLGCGFYCLDCEDALGDDVSHLSVNCSSLG